jgi:PTS system glucose-specific IIA component
MPDGPVIAPFFSNLVESEANLEFRKRIPVISPVNGKVKPLNQYPSKLYTQRMFGEGVAIELSGYQVLAPFDCIIEQLYPTAEQIRIRSAQGIRMQIQLGVKTETMMGNGFRLYGKKGDKIPQGAPILAFDLRKMKDNLTSAISAITILNSDKLKGVKANYIQARANEDILLFLYV